MTHTDLLADPFLTAMADAVEPRTIVRDDDVIAPWLTDWRGRYNGATRALLQPSTIDDLRAIVRLCAAHRVPIVPQGGNSGMVGGATPDASGDAVLLSLRRMDRIRSLDADARLITAEAGVILQNLHEAAERAGLRFPLTLGGKGAATIGGLVSTNAGGTQVLRHGVMRQLTMGIEAVLADGSLYSALVPLKKDNRGYDLKQLFIGAEGTLGIITAATLRLAPAVADRRVIWAALPSVQDARRLLLLAQATAGDALEGFEVLPDHCLQSVLAYNSHARAPLAGTYPWHALIELVSTRHDDQSALDALAMQLLEAGAAAGLINDATIAANETQAEAFWLLRDQISPAERAKGPAMQHDISVPVAKMADFIDEAVPLVEQRFAGTRALAFGHLGDGNVHFHVLVPPGADGGAWSEGQGKAISAFVHDLVTQWQGSISAEHGIGQMKRDELARLGDPAALAMMQAIRHALDPLGIMNPGKLLASSGRSA